MASNGIRIRFSVLTAIAAVLALALAAGALAQEPPPPPPKPPIPPVPPVPTVPTFPTVPTVPEVPEVPKDPKDVTDLVTPLSAQMFVTPKPARAAGLPARFQLTGWLRPPMRLDRVSGFFRNTFGIDLGVCRGPVTIAYKSAGAVFATQRVSVTRMCTFESSITIRSRGRLGPRGRVRATARFAGNKMLGAAQHSTVLTVR
jgi:hypothetical protein